MEEQTPPLTEEEVLSAKRDIERTRQDRKTHSPSVLLPFPWVPKVYMPSDDEELSSDSEDDN